MRPFWILLMALVGYAAPALAHEAQEYPWYDLQHRLSIGASARYQWFAATDGDVTPITPREFVAGPVFAYELTEHLTATGSVFYGVDSKVVTTTVGLTIPLFGGE